MMSVCKQNELIHLKKIIQTESRDRRRKESKRILPLLITSIAHQFQMLQMY